MMYHVLTYCMTDAQVGSTLMMLLLLVIAEG